MPIYSGNLIGRNGDDGTTLSGVAANNYKTQPSTRFGTRQVQRISIYTTADTTANYLDTNSLYSQLVRAIQQNVEVYAVHMPNPSFFSCWGNFCFQVDIAYDTANDIWNAENSFIDDGDPVNWYFGPANGSTPYNVNPNGGALLDSLVQALEDAGENNYVFPMITWTVGDMTWPSNDNTIAGGLTPESVVQSVNTRKPASITNINDLAVQPGETATSRFAKLAAWIKTFNT
jgi:hypothetical protein